MNKSLSITKRLIRKLNNEGPRSLYESSLKFCNGFAALVVDSINQRIKHGSSAANPFQIISINPQNVEYIMIPAFSFTKNRYKTHIIGGNWDQQHSKRKINIHRGGHPEKKLIKVENYGFYKSFENHFQNGIPWEETDFYQWAVEDARKQNIGGHYETMESIRCRLNEIDKIYESIQTEGYKSQRKLNHFTPSVNEVQVNIGRHGEIIFDEGKHRFAISRILGISSIPVRVFVRHEEWQKIRKEVSVASNKAQLSKTAKKNLHHPDLSEINSHLI